MNQSISEGYLGHVSNPDHKYSYPCESHAEVVPIKVMNKERDYDEEDHQNNDTRHCIQQHFQEEIPYFPLSEVPFATKIVHHSQSAILMLEEILPV